MVASGAGGSGVWLDRAEALRRLKMSGVMKSGGFRGLHLQAFAEFLVVGCAASYISYRVTEEDQLIWIVLAVPLIVVLVAWIAIRIGFIVAVVGRSVSTSGESLCVRPLVGRSRSISSSDVSRVECFTWDLQGSEAVHVVKLFGSDGSTVYVDERAQGFSLLKGELRESGIEVERGRNRIRSIGYLNLRGSSGCT